MEVQRGRDLTSAGISRFRIPMGCAATWSSYSGSGLPLTIAYRSDPDQNPVPGFDDLGTLAREGDFGATGAQLILFGGNLALVFTFGFDAEFVYDPFGVGVDHIVDTSDDVRASGIPVDAFNFALEEVGPPFISPRAAPEPSSLAVLAIALAALGCLLAHTRANLGVLDPQTSRNP
jgi:hypothetical protein